MQKIIFLALMFGFCIISIYTNSLFYNFNNRADYYTYTYLNNDKIVDCGNFNITNTFNILSFGECITLNKKIDIKKVLSEFDFKVVAVENISGVKLYTLYYSNIPKYKILNNCKFNVQIAIKNDFTKIGYPAIFDSF